MSSKRLRYSQSASCTESSSTESETEECHQITTSKRKTREPKSFSKNALMARENRLKKKLYMENLERELTRERHRNKKYSNIVKQQAEIIAKRDKEIKYMRGILANNADISRLLKTLHQNTGMSVGTSLNRNFTIDANKMAAMTPAASPADALITDLHPWSDAQLTMDGAQDIPTLGDFDDILDLPPISPSLDDHTYTIPSSESDEKLGVCLHISNHKVSLEYCSQCHENANRVWQDV